MKTKHCSQRLPIVGTVGYNTETYALIQLSSLQNLWRKDGKFDHRPGRPLLGLLFMETTRSNRHLIIKIVRPYYLEIK